MTQETRQRCDKSIARGFHSTKCSRRGVIEEANGTWCKQHAPSNEKKRAEESHKRWQEEYNNRPVAVMARRIRALEVTLEKIAACGCPTGIKNCKCVNCLALEALRPDA